MLAELLKLFHVKSWFRLHFSVQRLDVSYTPKQGIPSPDTGLYLPLFQNAIRIMNQFSVQMVTVGYYGAVL